MSAKRRISNGVISGSVLKVVAVITMLIDHIAYGLLYRMFYFGMLPAGWDTARADEFYRLCRHIGRTAFPIYCFLLVEGFFHTKSRVRYMIRLLIFSILSEVFFDLTLTVWVNPERFAPIEVLKQNPNTAGAHQNVFFTLAIGLAVIWGIDVVKRLFLQGNKGHDTLRILRMTLTIAASAVILYAGCFFAHRIDTDYRYWGVLMIALFYLFADDRRLQVFVPYIALCLVPYLLAEVLPAGILQTLPETAQGFITPWASEAYALGAFILILLYNGQRGFLKGNTLAKYGFYAFYPAHLAVIYLVRILILN